MKESDTVLDVIKTRRSVRKFDGTKIPEECMQQILEAGRWAPSGANAQPWRFIIVTEKENQIMGSESIDGKAVSIEYF
ncbi:MAG: nitroreductase family protein [Candidatus Methanoperedens sp.]|nr:nitroreductase family protein [Candidatus Methanoperedens sp.]